MPTSDSESKLRFVVLRHDPGPKSSRPLHWDLMIEKGEALRTWALEEQLVSRREIFSQQLPDHRLAYLDYEGPVSDERGSLSRLDAGHVNWLTDSALKIVVQIAGRRFSGQITLARPTIDDQRWRVRFEDADSGA